MHTRSYIIALGILVLLTVGSAATTYFMYVRLQQVEQELIHAHTQAADLAEVVRQKEEEVEVHKELIRIFRQQSSDTSYDFSQMRTMIEAASKTIDDIKKLEEADEELLAKYSKVYFLNEHYVPDTLSYIPSEFVMSEQYLQIKSEVAPFLIDMLNAMESQGLNPRIVSAYRSYGYQEQLKHNHSVTYGTTISNQFVADQGYSEHQLGTTVDISNTTHGGDLEAFKDTPEYAWLRAHAHEYGFVLSYPKENTYYAFEPWHWRFVGTALAGDLHEANAHFYDWAQRDINAYRLEMFAR